MAFKHKLNPEVRDRLEGRAREMERLFALPDRFLGRELINLSRKLRNRYPDELGRPIDAGYEGLVVWAILPRLAMSLGEQDLTALERECAAFPPQDPDGFRAYVGNCLNNAGFRFLTGGDGPGIDALRGSFANGSPVTIALDRVAPPTPDATDWVARHIREISRARFKDERFTSWSPSMQTYPNIATQVSLPDEEPAISTSPSPIKLPGIIRTVVAEYAEQGISLWSIGDGHCENFADRVLDLWVGEGWQRKEGQGFTTVWTDQLCDEDGQFDLELIEAQWGGLPENVTPEDLQRIGCPNHMWIQAGGLAFDAEAPDGVERFLELPFFQRHLAPEPSLGM